MMDVAAAGADRRIYEVEWEFLIWMRGKLKRLPIKSLDFYLSERISGASRPS